MTCIILIFKTSALFCFWIFYTYKNFLFSICLRYEKINLNEKYLCIQFSATTPFLWKKKPSVSCFFSSWWVRVKLNFIKSFFLIFSISLILLLENPTWLKRRVFSRFTYILGQLFDVDILHFKRLWQDLFSFGNLIHASRYFRLFKSHK